MFNLFSRKSNAVTLEVYGKRIVRHVFCQQELTFKLGEVYVRSGQCAEEVARATYPNMAYAVLKVADRPA